MFQTASQLRFWIVLGLILGFAGIAQAQHSIALGITNVRPTNLFSAHVSAGFVGVNLDYQYRFQPKLPTIFAGITAAYFPAIDYDMDKRLFVHDPFGRYPQAKIAGLMLGARQNLRQKRNVQPYLELAAAGYFMSRQNDPNPNPIAFHRQFKGMLLGGLAGTGIRFVQNSGLFMGVHTRLHAFSAFNSDGLYAYFEWGGFLGYTFPNGK